ncbi:MAG TPA: prepilin-type N-terminal cleavage/methylation domain-containing protein [Acidobacteriota bacterium]|nr:prepilin-type N-terminal cleavage/methylation domain-containing protein [Acidobacteriota bacterium]
MNKRRHILFVSPAANDRPGGNAGFSLIELLAVVIIVGLLASVAMQSLNVAIEDARRARTEREMDVLARSIVGDPSIMQSGRRADFGYVGDVGAFPADLDALYRNSGGLSTWKGPYLPPGLLEDTSGFRIDEWGRPYTYGGGITIVSTGGSRVITLKIADAQSDYLLNTVRGDIRDANDSVPGSQYADSVDVVVTVPDGAGSVITKLCHPDATGAFILDSLPAGRHPLRLIYQPAADTLARPLTVLPRHRNKPVLQYRFASAHFSSGGPGGGCGGSGADTLRPNTSGSSTELLRSGCAANWQCVDDVTTDGDATTVRTIGNSYLSDTYNVDDPADTTCTITGLTVYARMRRSRPSSAFARLVIHTGGADYAGNQTSVARFYTDYNWTWASNPATGDTWTWADVRQVQCGIRMRSVNSSAFVACTQVWLVVEYE